MMLVTSIHADVIVKNQSFKVTHSRDADAESVKGKKYLSNIYQLMKNVSEYSMVRELACSVCGCVIQRVKTHSQSK